MARMRYVIKKPDEGFFTEMEVIETKAVKLHKIVVGYEQVYRPVFKGMQHGHASQFNTKKDAEDLMTNADFGAPESFAGCVIVANTSEHEPE